MSEIVKLEKSDGVATVTIDRGEKRNALNQEMVLRLTEIALDLQQDTDIACVVLTGNQKEFSAGIDLGDPARWSLEDKSFIERRAVAQRGSKMCRAWEDIPQITIAAVEGLNVGGGIALTLACDWRVMAKSAFLYVPEVQIGIPLGWQTVPRLVNLVGPARAKQIVLLGEKMSAEKALEWGVIDFIAPDGTAMQYAQELAQRVSKMPDVAVRMSKQSINAYTNALNYTASHMDLEQAMLCGQEAAAKAGRASYKS